MSVKNKALALNFVSSALFFLGFRFGLPLLLDLPALGLVIGAGVAALILSPKFLVSPDRKNPKLLVKWLWSKKEATKNK